MSGAKTQAWHKQAMEWASNAFGYMKRGQGESGRLISDVIATRAYTGAADSMITRAALKADGVIQGSPVAQRVASGLSYLAGDGNWKTGLKRSATIGVGTAGVIGGTSALFGDDD